MNADKIKKMEELRKRLQSMNKEQFSELLDNSNDVEQWRIDLSFKQKGEGNVTHLPDVKQKMSESRKQAYLDDPNSAYLIAENARKGISKQSRKKQANRMKQWHENALEHKEKLREKFIGENNPSKRPEVIAKRNDSFRTTGRMYIELNSKSFGYVSDLADEFKISKTQLYFLAEGERIPKRGRAVGLLIRFYDESIHPPFSELNDIRKIKK